MAKCLQCRSLVSPGGCLAESYGNIIDRDGRHEGYCWGGRFPSRKHIDEWQERLALKQAQGHLVRTERAVEHCCGDLPERCVYACPLLDVRPGSQLVLNLVGEAD